MDSGAAKLNSIDDRYRANKLTLNSSSFLEGEMGWGWRYRVSGLENPRPKKGRKRKTGKRGAI